MHFRILLGGHYHLVCLKLHGGAVLGLLGVVLVLDKAAFHGAGAITLKDVPDQVGKALVGAVAGAFNALLLFVRVIFRFGVVGLIAAGKVSALPSYFALMDDSFRYGFGGVAQFSVGQVLHQLPALNGCGEGDRVLAHGHHVLLVGLGQVSKGQVVTANVIVLTARFEKCIAAGVVVIGHIAVGSHGRALFVDMIALGGAGIVSGGAKLYDIGAEDLLLLFFVELLVGFAVSNSSQVGFDSFLLIGEQFNFTILLDRIVSHSAGDLVESTLVRMLVLAALVLVVTGLIIADLVVQTHILVPVLPSQRVLVCQQMFGAVVPLQLRVHQHAVVDLRRSVFLLLRQGQLGIRCQIKVFDVVVVIVNFTLYTVDLYIVSAVPPVPLNIIDILRRNTLHHLISGIPVVRCCSQKRCGAIVVFAGVLGGGFQLLQVRDQFGIGHGIVVDHVSYYLGDLIPCHFFVNDQGLDLAVLRVLDDKGLTFSHSILTGFFQILEECFLGFFLGAAGGCNHVRLLDFHSQFFFQINIACLVGLAIFSRVGNGMFGGIHFVIAFTEFFVKLSLDV